MLHASLPPFPRLQVLLKIIKHAHGMLPQYAAGSLLGLDEKNTLDVTNTFPFPQGKSTEATYQTDMLEVMRRVRAQAWPCALACSAPCMKRSCVHLATAGSHCAALHRLPRHLCR